MSGRVNHPFKSFVLFCVVLGFLWAAYEFLYVRRIFEGQPESYLDDRERDVARDRVLERFSRDTCLLELGPLHYRPKEDQYRLDVRIADTCHARARDICEEVSDIVMRTVGRPTAVWAYDDAGTHIAHHVP